MTYVAGIQHADCVEAHNLVRFNWLVRGLKPDFKKIADFRCDSCGATNCCSACSCFCTGPRPPRPQAVDGCRGDQVRHCWQRDSEISARTRNDFPISRFEQRCSPMSRCLTTERRPEVVFYRANGI